MGQGSLAIIIPAYKKTFLAETLDSISRQTCRNFTLYVFDDASDEPLEDIVRSYSTYIDVVFHRFSENRGQTDLVAHWERCIDHIGDEDWIWMFSDDDLMDKECVASFYQFLENDKNASLVHFNTRVIDASGDVSYVNLEYPEVISHLDYLTARLKHRLLSTAVEYIFRKDLFVAQGGFVNFPLAWCADTATWVKLAKKDGIKTISGPKVSWRSSGVNISTWSDEPTRKLKFESCMAFTRWTNDYLSAEGEPAWKWTRARAKWLLSKATGHTEFLTFNKIHNAIMRIHAHTKLSFFAWAGYYIVGFEVICKRAVLTSIRALPFFKREAVL